MSHEPNRGKFYLVWHPRSTFPKFRHDNEQMALIEARRLSKLNPGHHFYVLENMGHTIVPASEPRFYPVKDDNDDF